MTTAKTPKLPETEFQLPEPEKTQDEKMTASPTSISRRSLRTNSRA